MRQSKAVKSFKGLEQYRTAGQVSMDYALDQLNCFVSTSGALEKMRVPIPLAPPFQQATNANMFDFQRADGLRQLIVTLGSQIWKLEGDDLTPSLLGDNPLYMAEWSMVESNNILFMANGNLMLKWTGTALQAWGIPKPATPTLGQQFTLTGSPALSRTANVVTATGVFTSLQGLLFPTAVHVGDLITISAAADPSFNGTFVITQISPSFQWAQTAANATTNAATLTFPYGMAYFVGIVSVTRKSGVVTCALPSFLDGWNKGDDVIVTGVTDSSFNTPAGTTFKVTGSGPTDGLPNDTLTWNQPGLGDASSSGGTIAPGTDSSAGYAWRVAYGNSVTGHVGTASDPVSVPALSAGSAQRIFTLIAVNPGFPQIDTLYWFRTLRGGGDYFLEKTQSISQVWMHDSTNDSSLDTTTKAPLINDAPPTGKYLMKWQGRIFVAGIVGSPQDIAYSGYERIFLGRPEESFPPNNRLRLSVGADDVRALGAIQQGLVAWSHSSEMFMLKGTVEDITVTAPVNFSAYLDPLPWDQGANSFYAVETTPRGVVWWASDNSVELWNGAYYGDVIAPKTISDGVYPLLQRATDSVKQFAQSAWLNYNDREWYILILAIDGATQANRLVFFDLTEGDDNAGAFISDIQADAIAVREDSRGGRHLLIISQGSLYELNTMSTAQNGVLGKKGLDVISGCTISLSGTPNPNIPQNSYFGRLVKISFSGGETSMTPEFGTFTNGGAFTAFVNNVPQDPDVMRWRFYFGTATGQLTQYVDQSPSAVIAAGNIFNISGVPQNFMAPPQRKLSAFWRGGWFGNDTPDLAKMFRDGHLITSQVGFKVSAFLANDEDYTFDNPLKIDCPLNYKTKYSVNWSGRRMSPLIQFPDSDVPASVIEFSASYNAGGQR